MTIVRADFDAVNYIVGFADGAAATARGGAVNAATYSQSWVDIPRTAALGSLTMSMFGTSSNTEEYLQEWARDTENALHFMRDQISDALADLRTADQRARVMFEGKVTADEATRAPSIPAAFAADVLVEPHYDQGLGDAFNTMGMAGNVISPAWWLGEAAGFFVDLVTNAGVQNPFDEVGRMMGGDWTQFSKAGDGVQKLSVYWDTLSVELGKAATKVNGDWQGATKDAAHAFMANLCTSFDEIGNSLSRASGAYASAAWGVHGIADGLSSLFMSVADLTLVAMISAGATAALSWTGIGLLVGGSATVAAVTAVVGCVYKIINLLSTVWTVYESFAGAIMLLGSSVGSVSIPSVTIQTSY